MYGVKIQDIMFISCFSSTLNQFKQMIPDVECCVIIKVRQYILDYLV